MPEYKCEVCLKIFKQKSDYTRHINRKNPCKENRLYKCIKCGKELKSYGSLHNHMKKNVCSHILKVENTDIKNINNISNVQYINNNIQNNQNIHMDNVKLIKFANEDLSMIKDDVYKKFINSGFKSVPSLIEHVHFNPHNPNQHNIYISNMKNTFILVFDGEKWEVKDRDDIIEDLMNSKTDHLLEKFDELMEELPNSAIKKFQRFIDKKDDDKVVEKIKKDIKLILYNNRHLPIEIRKKIESSDSVNGLLLQNESEEQKLEDKNTKINNILKKLEDFDENKIDDILELINKKA